MRLIKAHLDLDIRCNYNCIYCQNDSVKKDSTPWFLETNLEKILPVLSRSCWNVFLSCGGEPLMHPRFAEALEVADRNLKNCDVTLVTNGLLLTKQNRAAILKSCITRINISIHTLEPDIYGRLYNCSPENVQTVKENVEALARERGNRAWPKIMITSIAMKSTIDKIPNIARWVSDTRIDGMRIEMLQPYDTQGMEAEVISASDPAVYGSLAESAGILGSKRRVFEWPVSYGLRKLVSVFDGARLVRHTLEYYASFFQKLFRNKALGYCRIAGNSVRIDRYGNVKLCLRNVIDLPNLLEQPHVDLRWVIADALKRINTKTNKECLDGCPYRP